MTKKEQQPQTLYQSHNSVGANEYFFSFAQFPNITPQDIRDRYASCSMVIVSLVNLSDSHGTRQGLLARIYQ